MTGDAGNRGHRHPDAVAYLESLTEDGAAVHPPVVRRHGQGFTRYWLEGGEVRSRDIGRDGLTLAGLRPDGGPLPALPAAVSSEFGPQLPRLAADLASGAPDLDGGGRALRDASLGGGAAAPSCSSSGWTVRCRRRSARPAAGRWPGIRRRRSPS